MKKIQGMIFGLVLICSVARAQDPVQWKFSVVKTESGYELHLAATLTEGWHIYSQEQPKEAISEPTKIAFTPNPFIKYTGKPKEIGVKETYTDKEAGIIQFQYGHTVDFVQQLTVKPGAKTAVGGSVTYQVCTNEKCLQPKTVPFSVPVQ